MSADFTQRWGWFRCERQDKRRVEQHDLRSIRFLNISLSVDENLFYKGVDKTAVHGARLSQTSSISEPRLDAPPLGASDSGTRPDPDHQSKAPFTEERPPYTFKSGDELLALTRKHNVSAQYDSMCKYTHQKRKMTIAQIVHDNERYFGLSEADIHSKVCPPTSVPVLMAANNNRNTLLL